MPLRSAFLAAGLLAASLTPAFADSVTAKVNSWDAASRTITLEDKSQFVGIPGTAGFPQDITPGSTVTIQYQGSESGVDAIDSVKVGN